MPELIFRDIQIIIDKLQHGDLMDKLQPLKALEIAWDYCLHIQNSLRSIKHSRNL